jgi:hypothetical protein
MSVRELSALLFAVLTAAVLVFALFGSGIPVTGIRLAVAGLVGICASYLYDRVATGIGTLIVGEVNEQTPKLVKFYIDVSAVALWMAGVIYLN